MTERDLQRKCIEYLQKKHVYYINMHGGGWGAKGAPDLILCINGRFVAVELKIGSARLKPDQVIHKNRILKAGGIHYRVNDLDVFKQIVLSELNKGV